MSDPPREGVSELLARLRGAGVKTIMITGDQSATAHAVGRQIGLGAGDRLEIIDSTRLDTIPPEVLGTLAQRADIFSRVSPAHKLHIVRALQRARLVVAMTGDGINDGPALKAADIGVAMGAGGSVVAREMADLVLEQDDLNTLITAITQGRTIYQDIRKAVRFILITNLSELLFTITAVASGVAEPLTPLQLLWINLMTDIFPELALAVQPPESDVLKRSPRDPERPMFTGHDLIRVALEGGVLTSAVMANYLSAVRRSGPGPRASTLAFTSMMFAQLLYAFSAQSETHRVFGHEPIARNPWLPISIGGIGLVQLAVSALPPLRTMLNVVPLRAADWAKVAAAAVVPFVITEVIKTPPP
jgi:Ca2+-transporting ATPase